MSICTVIGFKYLTSFHTFSFPVATSAPTPSPTPAPSNSQCQAKVDIECVTEYGVPCNAIVPPESLCEAPNSMSFTYDSGASCGDSLNQQAQDGTVICEESGNLQTTMGVICVDAAATTTQIPVFPTTVTSGGEFSVFGANSNSPLPAKIQCNLYSGSPGNVIQSNVIDTTGSLYLKEKYGALQVQSCGGLQDCLQTATVTYTVRNEGNHGMEVVAITRDLTGEDQKNLVSGFSPNPLAFGGQGTVSEPLQLDVCSTNAIIIRADVDAKPEDGPECDGFSSYVININPICSLDVALSCTEEATGEPCDELMSIGAPTCDCSGECATELSYVYTGSPCDLSGAFVDECITGSPSRPDTVAVLGETLDGLSLFSEIVGPGDLITIGTGQSCLPDVFVVQVSDPGNTNVVYETSTIRTDCTTGGVPLGTTQGPLDIVGFVCASNGREDFCFTDVTIESCVVNEGTVPATLTEATIFLDDEQIASAPTQIIESGETICFDEIVALNMCGDPTFAITSAAEADDTSNVGCEAADGILLKPDRRPTSSPTGSPTVSPTPGPTAIPTLIPTARITSRPVTEFPTSRITSRPVTEFPTARITARPVTEVPTARISTPPVKKPTYKGKGKGKKPKQLGRIPNVLCWT